MKILVTGLCLSRNLGGAAMALTLIKELDRHTKRENEYLFCVSAIDFESEKIWARRYGLEVAPRAELEAYITHFTLWRYVVRFFRGKNLAYLKNAYRFWQNTWRAHTKALKESDLIINMEGVSYIGESTRDRWEGINSFSGFLLSKIFKKPYLRFIQSFGPLDRFDVRFFAYIEFRALPFVPARGKKSALECKRVLKDITKVYDFPDCALLLPKASKEWSSSFLESKNLKSKEFIILSPSSIVYNIGNSESSVSGEKYINYFKRIATYFIGCGERVLFLPHMYSLKKEECDREVARMISQNLEETILVEEDITPEEAKAIIAESKFALVSRYHALVAALSTQTPVIALGWNIKYSDLMEYYELEEYTLDCRGVSEHELFRKSIELYENYKEIDFAKLHKSATTKVDFAFELLSTEIEKLRA